MSAPTLTLNQRAEAAGFRLEDNPSPSWYDSAFIVRCTKSGRIVYRSSSRVARDIWACELLVMIEARCNRCGRPMTGTTAYDGACDCGGLIVGGGQ